MSSITLENVDLSYGARQSGAGRVVVLESLDLRFESGKTYGIYGPNGAGKSSMFRLIAGFEKPDAGQVKFGSKSATVSFVWQDYRSSLLPWYDVAQNVALTSLISGKARSRLANEARDALNALDLEIPLDRKTFELSGGQQQAVSIARAAAMNRSVLLMDEPFSALDSARKSRLLERLQSLLQTKAITTLLISHELDDLILMSDEIVVMSPQPMREISRVKVDIPFPRSERERRSDAFNSVRTAVLKEAEAWIVS